MSDQKLESIHELHSDPIPLNPARVRAPNFLSAYANQAHVASGPFDIRFAFSELEYDETGILRILERASIVMSPQHAKAFMVLLEANILRHEKNYGAIDITAILRTETPTEGG